MATVTVRLPTLLVQVVQAGPELVIEADRLDRLLADLMEEHPALRTHLVDEMGALREHVLCLYNGHNTRHLSTLDIPLRDGDEVVILQAVSGG
jgi:sulfur-carrier protein